VTILREYRAGTRGRGELNKHRYAASYQGSSGIDSVFGFGESCCLVACSRC
jgi:hypothetical protein